MHDYFSIFLTRGKSSPSELLRSLYFPVPCHYFFDCSCAVLRSRYRSYLLRSTRSPLQFKSPRYYNSFDCIL